MSAAPTVAATPSRPAEGAQPRQYTPGLSDGIGDRFLTYDSASNGSIELLRFKSAFTQVHGFEPALRKRVEALSRLRHPSLAVIKGLESGESEGLALASHHTAGRRLSEILSDARGAAFALEFIRQIAPALAAIHQTDAAVAHGALTPERIIATREGRLVIVEYVLGGALSALALPADRVRREIGVAVPVTAAAPVLDQRNDVLQLGLMALALLAGRRIEPASYPAEVPEILEAFSKADPTASRRLRPWLERALQIGPRPFSTGQEAATAFTASASESHAPASSAPQPTPAKTHSPAAEEPRPVLAFQKPIDRHAAPPSASHDPVGFTATGAYEDGEAAPVRSGRMTLLIKWGAAALGLVALVEGGILLKWYLTDLTSQPAVVALPPTRAEVAANVPPLVATPPPVGPAPTALGTPATIGAAGLAPGLVATPDEGVAGAVPTGRVGGVKVTSGIELQVFEGDKLLGSTTGTIAINDGSHTLEFVNEELGFRTRQHVTIRPGQLSAVTVAIPNGRLSVNAAPWAEVWIDGAAAGETPLANLSVPIGRHEIVFRHPQLGERREVAIVKADGLTRVSVTFQQ